MPNRLAVRLVLFLGIVAAASWTNAARADVFSNVAETAGYHLAYTFSIPNDSLGWNTTVIPYTTDNSANIADYSFSRVGYYLELAPTVNDPVQYVYASFDAGGFCSSAAKLGVPNTASGAFFQQNVANMNVASNVTDIVTGTGITTGNVEFWPSNYSQSNAAGVPNASDTTFDFGDGGAGTTAGHGSMQIHNHGAQQTLFAYNAWGGERRSELGIGNNPSGNPDWTFNTANIANYEVKNLQVVVGGPSRAPEHVLANAPELAGYTHVYTKALSTDDDYKTSAVDYDIDSSGTVADGSFDRVAYYLELDDQWICVSFDAEGFTDQADKIGIPDLASGEFYQQDVTNMNVASNVEGIVTGTGLSGGNIEFWATNYGTSNGANVPGASGSTYDFGDAYNSGDYGSMQIHNHEAGQTLFAYNAWGGTTRTSDLGIGNRSTDHPDWTFSGNAGSYTVKNLYIFVHPVPEPSSLALLLCGTLGLLAYRKHRAKRA